MMMNLLQNYYPIKVIYDSSKYHIYYFQCTCTSTYNSINGRDTTIVTIHIINNK